MKTFDLTTAVYVGGMLHFAILIAGALVPGVLNWKRELLKVSPMTRQIVWVHGAFVVLTIIGMGTIATFAAPTLAAGGDLLARGVCGFIAIFWLARLSLQFVLFDATPYFGMAILKFGYRGLTFVFTYFVLTFGFAAFRF